jgi:hypothetical protein
MGSRPVKYDGAEQRVRLARGKQSRFLFFSHGLADVVRFPLELHITLKVRPDLAPLQDLAGLGEEPDI